MTTFNKITFFLLFITVSSFSQKKEVTIKTHKLTKQVYMLTGQGGNIGLFISDDAVFMVDDQFAPLTPKILAAIKTVTDKPVNYVLNTHWHGDHTGGNENMKKEGAVIVSHENVRKRMSVDQFVRGTKRAASKKEALPIVTFTKDLSFHTGNEDILFFHVHNAHTDGDAIVYFPKNNVIHMGDTYFQGKFPFIDLESGGSIDGYITAIERVLLLANDTTKIIPGHRNISNKKELKAYHYMLNLIRSRIQAEILKQKTLNEVTTNKAITMEYENTHGDWFINAEEFRATVYKSLKK